MPERGSVKIEPAGGCAGVCGACPRARSCGSLTVKGESGSGKVLVFNNIKEILALPKLPIGRIYFDRSPTSQGSGEPPRTSEKICSECNETASTCPHSAVRTH